MPRDVWRWIVVALLLQNVFAAQLIKSPTKSGSTTYASLQTETHEAALAPTPKPSSPGNLIAEEALNVLKQLPDVEKSKSSPSSRRFWQRVGVPSNEHLATLDADLAKLRKLENVPEVNKNDAPHLKRAKAVRMLEVAAETMDSEEAAFMLAEINFVRLPHEC
jgi:hypothetical protein